MIKCKSLVIRNYKIKKAFLNLLKMPLFTRNPFYKYFYWQNIKKKIGDLKKDSIIKIWRGEKLNKIRKLHIEGRYNEIPIYSECTINTHYVTPWWP